MNATLQITSEAQPNQPISVVQLAGRLDASTVSQLEHVLTDAQVQGQRALVVAMGNLTYISSSGLRLLLSARAAARKRGGDVFLCALSKPVRDVFDMVGFSAVFRIFETTEQATEAAKILAGS